MESKLTADEVEELRHEHNRVDQLCGNPCCATCRVCGDLKSHVHCPVQILIDEHGIMSRELAVLEKKILNIRWLLDASPEELKRSWLDEAQHRELLIMDLLGPGDQDGVMPERQDFNYLRR